MFLPFIFNRTPFYIYNEYEHLSRVAHLLIFLNKCVKFLYYYKKVYLCNKMRERGEEDGFELMKR